MVKKPISNDVKSKVSLVIYFDKTLHGWHYYCILFLFAIVLLSIIYYLNGTTKVLTPLSLQKTKTDISNQIDIIDLQEDSKQNFTCIKTKYLLHIVRTTICLHDKDFISNLLLKEGIWEEHLLVKILGFLIRYPEMSFIDVGANIRTYTMFVASLGRFVLAIECFKPNIDRIRKAVQIEKAQGNVVLVGNAIFSESGQYLQLKHFPENFGGQEIIMNSTVNHSNNDIYAVKTVRFDDILPILQKKNIRNAIMKVDIQWSELFLCETGTETFHYVNLPIVLMEWAVHVEYKDRMRVLLNCFIRRGYVATADMCKTLSENDAFHAWPVDIYWVKMNQSEIC